MTRESVVTLSGEEGGLKPRLQAGLAVAIAYFVLSPAWAADGSAIVSNGTAAGAPACSSCHGAHGEGDPENGFPRLAGLKPGYIMHQLAGFADGSRQSDVMVDIAKALTAEEREAVASFYAEQEIQAAKPPAEPPDAKLVERGEHLANIGNWSQGVPGCGQCHAPNGHGVGQVFPPLAGQSATYIESQLTAWKEGKRTNDPLHLMSGIAKKLSDDDVKAAAAYYASLDAAAKEVSHE